MGPLGRRQEQVEGRFAPFYSRKNRNNPCGNYPDTWGDQVVLGANTVALLRDWLGNRTDGFVFPAITARHAQRRLSVWLTRVGITRRYSLHSFRHTFAMTLYSRTGDVLLVKEALRHRNICSTMVYATCPAARVREALRS